MPWVINGRRYKPAAHPPFVWGGDTVPRNSLRGHNAADLEAKGAVWENPPAPPEPPPPDVDALKAEKIAAAWAEHAARFHAYKVVVSVNGADRPYRCDPVTRENIMAIVTAINGAPDLVPNPRPYTPSGQITPVDTTHAEFQAIYFAGLAAGDAHYLAYATHKAAINALTDAADVQAYDVTTGWPT